MTQNRTAAAPAEDPALIAAFEARIAAGDSIEPKDWMPARYRQQLTRMMSQHAHSEVVGMLPEANWITRAPTLQRKISLIAKVQHCVLWLDGARVAYRTSSRPSAVPLAPSSAPTRHVSATALA